MENVDKSAVGGGAKVASAEGTGRETKSFDEQQIKERAYFIWSDEGRPEGRDLEYWLRARAELEGREVVHLICEDDGLRGRLSQLLWSEGYVARSHESPLRFLEAVGPESRGYVVADVRRADMKGAEFLKHMKTRGLNLPVVVVAAHADLGLAIQAMKEGAVDFIEMPLMDDALLGSVRAAFARAGESVDRDRERERHVAALATLTERERQLLLALIKGKTVETIAYELGVSAESVAANRAKLMAKLNAESLADLVWVAVHAIPVDDCA